MQIVVHGAEVPIPKKGRHRQIEGLPIPIWVVLGLILLMQAALCFHAIYHSAYEAGKAERDTTERLTLMIHDRDDMIQSYERQMRWSPVLVCSENWDTRPVSVECHPKSYWGGLGFIPNSK